MIDLTPSLVRLQGSQRKGRRAFYWVSSIDPTMEPHLDLLSEAMTRFYAKPATRLAYQEMIDSETAAQPELEGALSKAVLSGKPSAILEIGCGSGRIYARLQQEGLSANYTGVEVSPEVIQANRRRFPRATWICGNGYDLPVSPGTQDCVFAYYVLEHCVYPRRLLESMLLAVRPGGRILLTFPDMAASGICASQALGWDDRSAKSHLRDGRVLHAIVRLWDSRVRLPLALRRTSSKPGTFLVNFRPRCLEPAFNLEPDVDAVYIASRREVADWALSKGCLVDFPVDRKFELQYNSAVIQISKGGP
jgi:SAM-dependent methyltransferase